MAENAKRSIITCLIQRNRFVENHLALRIEAPRWERGYVGHLLNTLNIIIILIF